MSDAALPPSQTRAQRNVIILVLAQAFLGAQMSIHFIIGGLAGQMLSPNACLVTLPITLMILGSMLSASPLSALMQRVGRRAGFVLGTIGGGLGAGLCAWAVYQHSFALLLAGSALTGVYMSAQGFYRFAATDTAPESYRPKAISYVMAGGLAAAILGPQLVKLTGEAYVIPFLGNYLAIVALNAVGVFLFAFLDIPPLPRHETTQSAGRSRLELLRTPRIAVAIICGMVSYALMNMVMTSTSLAVVGCGFETNDAANIVTVHVLAMYAPSFVTGHLIARYGVERIVALGLAILGSAGVVALMGVELENFYIALLLLGIGWNFGFIGATAMLTDAHTPQESGRAQGLNDLIVFGGVMLASLASGGLMNCSGGSAQEGWAAVNMAMIPFLMLAGGALIWLVMRPQEA